MTTIPNFPNSSSYENILDAYFGDAYGDQQSGFVTQKDVLWSAFLLENRLAPDDPLVLAGDNAILAKFMLFAQKTYDSMQTSNLSPDEVTKRQLMFSVHDLIVLMLETLQKSVGVLGDNVVFLGKYQREFSAMMGREAEAFYIGGSTNIPSPNPGDLSKWTLGYEDITMQEYLDNAVYKGIEGVSQTLALNSINTDPNNPLKDALQQVPQTEFIALGPLTRTVYRDINVPVNTMTIASTPTSVQFNYIYYQQYDATYTPYIPDNQGVPQPQTPIRLNGFYPIVVSSPTTTFPQGASTQDKLDLTNSAFQSFLATPIANQSIIPPNSALTNPYGLYSNIPAAQNLTVLTSQTIPITFHKMSNIPSESAIVAVRNLAIPWNAQLNRPDVYSSDETERAKIGADVRRRGEANKLLQQYVTNTQGRRQVIGNQSDAQQSQMDQARTGITQAAGLLKTMIGQLSTILTSIFQVST